MDRLIVQTTLEKDANAKIGWRQVQTLFIRCKEKNKTHPAIRCNCGYVRPVHSVHAGMYMDGVTATQEDLQQLGLTQGTPPGQDFVCKRCQRAIDSIRDQKRSGSEHGAFSKPDEARTGTSGISASRDTSLYEEVPRDVCL